MKNLKKPLPLIFCIAGILGACQFTTSYTNREKDKNEAKKITDAFYADLKANKIDSLYPMFSHQFYEATPKDSLTKLFNFVLNACGEVRSDSLSDWETKITRGTTNESEYLLKYSVARSKHNSKEQIQLEKELNGEIKIVGYHVSFQ